VTPGRPSARHLRSRGDGLNQPITAAELFFDLVYALAVTQSSLAGIIAVAVGDDLLIAHPGRAMHGVGLGMVLGGPTVFLLGEPLPARITSARTPKRLAGAAILVLLAPIGSQLSALALSATVTALLSARAVWELRAPGLALGAQLGTSTDAPDAPVRDLPRGPQQQQEGTS